MAVWHVTKRPGLATRIALALALGLVIALADSSPGWDSSGITAGGGSNGSLLALVFASIGAAAGWALARAG